MNPDVLQRYAAPVPRYTSYPTAPHFTDAVNGETYASWLEALPSRATLSLYLHIPFCDRLCWYCGCTTKATRQYHPVAAYLDFLITELNTVADRLPADCRTLNIHWGGGSPSILQPDDILRLAALVKSRFNLTNNAEFAIEIDPGNIDAPRIAAFAEAGVNRVSIGVQDFSDKVQAAINRPQSIESTRQVVARFRDAGVRSINIDLVYGLPHQTRASVDRTIAEVIAMAPDRIALFGYAHLPSRLTHQRLIPDETLPGATERFAQANRAANRLTAAGFRRIGLDHFARPDDHLAQSRVHRNFQGYTTDAADALLGFGTSAIGKLPQGYVQNSAATADYQRRIGAGGLATARGRALTDEDRARGLVIERLMCDLAFPADELKARFPDMAEPLIAEAEAVLESDMDGLVAPLADSGIFRVTEKGRIFLRSVCACFDGYFGQSEARYSAGV